MAAESWLLLCIMWCGQKQTALRLPHVALLQCAPWLPSQAPCPGLLEDIILSSVVCWLGCVCGSSVLVLTLSLCPSEGRASNGDPQPVPELRILWQSCLVHVLRPSLPYSGLAYTASFLTCFSCTLKDWHLGCPLDLLSSVAWG